MSSIEQSVWYFWKRRRSRLAKSVSKGRKTVIYSLIKDCLACANGSNCRAFIPFPYDDLFLAVPSRYVPIPKPKIITPYNMVRAPAFTNELFWKQTSTGTQIWYCRINDPALTSCPSYWRNRFFANPEVCRANNIWILLWCLSLQLHWYFIRWEWKIKREYGGCPRNRH